LRGRGRFSLKGYFTGIPWRGALSLARWLVLDALQRVSLRSLRRRRTFAAKASRAPSPEPSTAGGGFASIAGLDDSEMETTHTSWFIVINNETGITLKIHASVECAGAGQAVAASVPRATHARFDQRVAELTAEAEASKQ